MGITWLLSPDHAGVPWGTKLGAWGFLFLFPRAATLEYLHCRWTYQRLVIDRSDPRGHGQQDNITANPSSSVNPSSDIIVALNLHIKEALEQQEWTSPAT